MAVDELDQYLHIYSVYASRQLLQCVLDIFVRFEAANVFKMKFGPKEPGFLAQAEMKRRVN